MTAKFASECAKCGTRIAKGQPICYDPSKRAAQCMGDSCGAQWQRDIAADDFDQAQYQSQYGGY
jgi:hypothetical protein